MAHCLEENPERRPATFDSILSELKQLSVLSVIPIVPVVQLAEETPKKGKSGFSPIPTAAAALLEGSESNQADRFQTKSRPEAALKAKEGLRPPQHPSSAARLSSKGYVFWGLVIAGVCSMGLVMLLTLIAIPFLAQRPTTSSPGFGSPPSAGFAPIVIGNWQAIWNGNQSELIALYPDNTFQKFFTAMPGDVVKGTYTFSNGTLVMTSQRQGPEQISLIPVNDKEMNATYRQGPTLLPGSTAHWSRRDLKQQQPRRNGAFDFLPIQSLERAPTGAERRHLQVEPLEHRQVEVAQRRVVALVKARCWPCLKPPPARRTGRFVVS